MLRLLNAGVQRTCADCETDPQNDLTSYLSSSAPTGHALPPDVRAQFEPRFGQDLGHVRVHADTRSAAAAHEIDALAFTHGSHIHFAQGRFDHGTSAGRRLLAHELAHVLYHQPDAVRRQPYHTSGMAFDPAKMEAAAATSFWEQKTLVAFRAAFDSRLTADPEERDAVLAAFWGMNPSRTVTAHRVIVVPIKERKLPLTKGQKTPATTESLLYRFTFDPPADPKKDKRPRLSISFVASGAAANAVAATPAPATFVPTKPALTFSGFPGKGVPADITRYFSAHADEHRALFQFLETQTPQAPATFDQVVTTTTQGARGGQPAHQSVFHVTGSRTGRALANLDIGLVSEGPIEKQQTVGADYREHDWADLKLEELQARKAGPDRLGSVTLPAGLPRDERQALKYAIWQYFEAGKTRNTEVDAIVPVGPAASPRRILYTLQFGKDNNVTVTRIGEAGTGAGKVDVQRIDVTRVRGFPGASAAPAKLQAWWSTRYPKGGALTKTSSAALIVEMNQLIDKGIAATTWFDQNYGVEVLTAAKTTERLKTVHGAPTRLIGDTDNFSGRDLRMLELSFQTLGDLEIPLLKNVRFGRKHKAIDRKRVSGKMTWFEGAADTAGLRLGDGTATTIVYFDAIARNAAALFTGSAANALPEMTLTFLHEIGHAVGDAAAKKEFDKWIGKNPQAPQTKYAATDPDEVFAETYSLYHGDPHFLCNSAPLLFAWFDVLAKTGAAPAAGAALKAPTTCP